MKSRTAAFGVAFALVVAVAIATAPVAKAQCSPAQVFGSVGLAMGGAEQVDVTAGVAHNAGLEIGRFWAAANSNNANNFGGTCPSTNVVTADSWWDLVAGGPKRGIQGAITGGTCTASSCPSTVTDQMVWVVEDFGPTGPPGVGDTAFWIGFRVDSPGGQAGRVWDLAKVSGNPTVNMTLPFLEFPTAVVTSSLRDTISGGVDTTQNYVDAGPNMHSATGAGNTPLPDNSTIVSYDICTFFGGGDPGRARQNWNCDTHVPYANAGVVGNQFEVPCPNTVSDMYLAIGLTFDGGAGPDVLSSLVGRAIQVECNPDIADPEPMPHKPGIRPKKPATKTPARTR